MVTQGEGVQAYLSEVCDFWECLHAFWGVQITCEMTYSTQRFPSYCEMLYTVYNVQGERPEILFQHSRTCEGLKEFISVADLYNDLNRIELTLSRNWEECAAPRSPARALLQPNDINSYSIMYQWWRAGERYNHV